MPPSRKHALTNKDKKIDINRNARYVPRVHTLLLSLLLKERGGKENGKCYCTNFRNLTIDCLSKQLMVLVIFEAMAQNSAFAGLSTVL